MARNDSNTDLKVLALLADRFVKTLRELPCCPNISVVPRQRLAHSLVGHGCGLSEYSFESTFAAWIAHLRQ